MSDLDQGPLLDVAIIGAGFSGLGMAIKLLEEGKRSFKIFEKAQDVGGTWRENTYPGCACDIPSHLYSFSYAQNPNWSRLYPSQPEIWDYLQNVREKFGIGPFIDYGKELKSAHWNEQDKYWALGFGDGSVAKARVLVSATGPLHYPMIPGIKGLDNFKGAQFHSATWDHDYDLTDKRVAVIGTGASAIQIIPSIVDKVKKLAVFQRTPPWIMPRPDRAIRPWEKWLFKHLPFTQTLFRTGIYWLHESRAYAFIRRPGILKLMQKVAKRHIHRHIKDPALREAVTPDYVMGCKRVLISDDYYPALAHEKTTVIRTGIDHISENAIHDSDGQMHEVDAIIFSTGFRVANVEDQPEMVGRGGKTLTQAWSKGAEAYLGLSVPGFPNFFIMTGPNTGLGHNSVVFMVETMVHYIMDALKKMDCEGIDALDVRQDIHDAFNDEVQEDLQRTVWESGCKSWYQTDGGRNTTLWPGFTVSYWWKTRSLKRKDYEAV